MMMFNSYSFIFVFLPLFVAVYFLCAKITARAKSSFSQRLSECVLIAGSVIFYTALDLRIATVLFVSVAVNYAFILLLTRFMKKRSAVMIPVVLNIALLLYFKYTNFIIENINLLSGSHSLLSQIALPLGISFFTFQQIAYVVSYYTGELSPAGQAALQSKQNHKTPETCQNPDFLDYLTYILYFPKLVSGPLMEPADFLAQIHDPAKKKINLQNIACGIKIFSYGLFKKMIIADTFARAVYWGLEHAIWPSSLDWMLIIIFNSFMIYFDFSGYTDMATGVSLMLNITLPINFDSPYKAVSVRNFWKRWHISLTRFLTKYIYLPLGGNRKGKRRTCINVMLVFFISGVWHGANLTFIVWGILHGVLSVAERVIEWREEKLIQNEESTKDNKKRLGNQDVGNRLIRLMKWSLTFMIVSFLWLLFSAPSIEVFRIAMANLFSFDNLTLNIDLLGNFAIPESSLFILPIFGEFFLRNAEKIWMLVFTLGAAWICFIPSNNYKRLYSLRHRDIVLCAICFVMGVLALGQESVFVYFNF